MYTNQLNDKELEQYDQFVNMLNTHGESYTFARAIATHALAWYIAVAAEYADINSIEEDACDLANGWKP